MSFSRQTSHCKFYRTTTDSNIAFAGEDTIVTTQAEPPTENYDVAKFIAVNGLKDGDVVSFGSQKAENSFIVWDSSWIRNPDDSRGGYLTIPATLLENFDDAISKYKLIIGKQHSINLHLGVNDKTIKEKFESRLPEHWTFDLHFVHGKLFETFVCFADKRFPVDFNAVKFDDLLALESSANETTGIFSMDDE